jgi:pimeloyl-ACP methyl ester carboxylesterase
MGGANLSPQVSHLVLYEPSLGLRYPAGAIEEAEKALQAGDRETAVTHMLIDILELTPEEVDGLRATPRWRLILAGAHTTPRECRVEQGWVYQPGQLDGITAPTLLLSGSESPAAIIAATDRAATEIPDARIHVLEGHGHFAHRTHPAMVVSVIEAFLAGERSTGG